MRELKSCPFCGDDWLTLLPDVADWYVYCPNCGACGGSREMKQEAIEAWNRRADT